MIIPSGVFNKYAEAADLMLSSTVFGKSCTLVYTETLVSGGSSSDLNQRRTFNSTGPRGDEVVTLTESTETVTLRVYWDKKSFLKIGGIELPDGSCMTIGPSSLRAKLEKAAYLRIFSSDAIHQFAKAAESKPWGLDSNYIVSYWGRA